MNGLGLDQAQLERQLGQLVETGMNVGTAYGLKVLGAIVILIAGWIAAGVVSRAILRTFGRFNRVDRTVVTFAASTAKYGVLTFTVIAVLASVGVQTTSFVAVLGALGLAIGLALQGTLNHVASGLLLVIFRPFRVDDFIEAAGVSGTVKAITLFTTELATVDNVRVVVPNGAVWGGVIRNFSGHPTRRIDVEVGIGYGDSIEAAFATARAVVEADARILKDPAPVYAVSALADSAVTVLVRVWVGRDDVLGVRYDLNRNLKEAFERAGLTIPFPQRVVHHIHGKPAATDA
jgi:small conductance mechanosensitive channel